MSDIYVYQLELPANVREMVTPGADDSYTVYINARLSESAKVHALAHAVDHCRNNDFEKDVVQDIEAEAHRRERNESRS